ncbi:MAG: hypothetical protein MZU97_15620 [Bacillus subtilis]|nr:hypothetical protein [Bacillus subtilis]
MRSRDALQALDRRRDRTRTAQRDAPRRAEDQAIQHLRRKPAKASCCNRR